MQQSVTALLLEVGKWLKPPTPTTICQQLSIEIGTVDQYSSSGLQWQLFRMYIFSETLLSNGDFSLVSPLSLSSTDLTADISINIQYFFGNFLHGFLDSPLLVTQQDCSTFSPPVMTNRQTPFFTTFFPFKITEAICCYSVNVSSLIILNTIAVKIFSLL